MAKGFEHVLCIKNTLTQACSVSKRQSLCRIYFCHTLRRAKLFFRVGIHAVKQIDTPQGVHSFSGDVNGDMLYFFLCDLFKS